MLLKTSLFDPDHLLMVMPKWSCSGRPDHYPPYIRDIKGVKWSGLTSVLQAPRRGQVLPGRNAQGFPRAPLAHDPQAPPLRFGTSGCPPRRPGRRPVARGGGATRSAFGQD